MKNLSRQLGVLACACSALAGSPAPAATLELELGVEHSDNIGRTPSNEESETTGIAGIAFGIESDRPRLDTEVTADFEFRKYLDNAYDDEIVGGVNGLLSYAFIPERFVWFLEDNFGQISESRTLADTPDNRQNFNYFTTGPDLTVPLGARTAAQLSARWSDSYFENTDEDSQTREGSAALIRTLSERTSVSVNASAAKIEYDRDEIFLDSEINEAFMRLVTAGSRTEFSADLGYTETERGDVSSNGVLARITAALAITSRSTLSFSAGSEFADTGGAFRIDQSLTGVELGSDEAIAAADVFRDTYAYLELATEQDRTSFSVSIRGSREEHEQEESLDRSVYGGAFDFTRRLSPRLALDVAGYYDREKFKVTDVKFDEWSVGAGLSWQLLEAWSIRLRAEHFGGSGDGVDRDYDENRASLTVHYSLGR